MTQMRENGPLLSVEGLSKTYLGRRSLAERLAGR